MLRVEDLGLCVGNFTLRDVSCTVAQGDYFVLLGASGVGKTLFLEALAGLIPLDTGRLFWGGEEFTRTRIQDRGMGLVYQDQALFPHMTVFQNILYGVPRASASLPERRALARALAEKAGVQALLHRYPGTLSGGEAQRVALARALATNPRCLLLDEPLSALDPQSRGGLRALLRRLHRQGQTVIHVTHDYEEALSLATTVGIMEEGTIVQMGPPSEVFQHPKSEFVARFIGIRNVFSGHLESCGQASDDGAVFKVQGNTFHVLTDAPPGEGMLLVRSEDITLSGHKPDSSAQNCFEGVVVDVVPARLGTEVYVDIGVEMAVLVTAGSVQRMQLQPGASVWLSFKASAARFLEA